MGRRMDSVGIVNLRRYWRSIAVMGMRPVAAWYRAYSASSSGINGFHRAVCRRSSRAPCGRRLGRATNATAASATNSSAAWVACSWKPASLCAFVSHCISHPIRPARVHFQNAKAGRSPSGVSYRNGAIVKAFATWMRLAIGVHSMPPPLPLPSPPRPMTSATREEALCSGE